MTSIVRHKKPPKRSLHLTHLQTFFKIVFQNKRENFSDEKKISSFGPGVEKVINFIFCLNCYQELTKREMVTYKIEQIVKS